MKRTNVRAFVALLAALVSTPALAHGEEVLVLFAGLVLVQVALFCEMVFRSRHSRDLVAAILLYLAAVVAVWAGLFYVPMLSDAVALAAMAVFPRVACMVFMYLLRRMK